LIPQQRKIAKLSQSGVASVVRTHACSNVLGSLTLEMVAQFRIEARRRGAAREQH